MSKLLLKLIMLFSGVWKAFGADIPQLKAILQTKLMLDDRRPVTFGMNKGSSQGKKNKPKKNTIIITMLLSFVTGIIYVFPIIMTEWDVVIGLTFFYTFFMFFLTFTLLTDFVNVIVDTQDKHILFSRPVSDKTIILSRLLYISVYLFRMVLPMSIPAWILFGILHGWLGAVWFIFPLILSMFIVLFLVFGLYVLMIRIAGAGKFKDILNYFQIVFSIVFFMVWMFSSRMIDVEAFENMDLQMYSWVKFLPSYWLATGWAWVDSTAKVLQGTAWMGVLAIVFPFVSLWATVKWLAPQFMKSLVTSDNIEQKAVKKEIKVNSKGVVEKKLYRKLADIFTKNDTEKAGFIITWLQTTRSRTFRMRVYPTLAYVPVYFFYLLMMGNKPFSEVWEGLPESHTHITLLYMTFFVVMQALNFVTMSEQYKAAWIYMPTPVEPPGLVLGGAFKAVMVRYFLPFMLAIGAFVVFIWGPSAIFDVLLATANVTLFSAAMVRINYRFLPFSRKEQTKDSGGKTIIRVIATFLLIGILGFTHFMLSSIALPDGTKMSIDLSGFFSSNVLVILSYSLRVVFLVLSSIFLWLIYDSIKNTSWQQIRKAGTEM